jgi:hypothetical protein
VRTLRELQKEGKPPAVRLGAAKAVLEVGLKVCQLVELEGQMAALEERVAQLNQPR